MSMYKVQDSTNCEIQYEVFENTLPQTTFFIHGNLCSSRWWYPALESLKSVFAISKKIHQQPMICANFRGCGQSTAPKSLQEVSMSVFADDFIGLIESLNISEKVNLVGHSTGGLIAALMMAKKPELFNKAVLLDPVGAKGVKFDESMISAFEQMKVDKDLVGIIMGSTIYQNDPSTEFFKKTVVEDAFSAVKSVGHWVLKALDGFDGRSEISKVQNPTLVLHGEYDFLLPMQDSQDLAAQMKNAHFEVVKNQGHCANVENPQNFAQILDRFLFSN
ncbi:MAG: alpha/beta fold hydrolase [Pseudobdellovibrionaceae bacterium]